MKRIERKEAEFSNLPKKTFILIKIKIPPLKITLDNYHRTSSVIPARIVKYLLFFFFETESLPSTPVGSIMVFASH